MADENKQKEANFHFYLNTQGVRGRKGEKGDTGFSPTITVSEDTLNTYKLKVLTVDGEFETANLRGSIIEDGQGSFIRYDKETDKLYVGDIDQASPTIYGVARTATEEDLVNVSETAVTTVSDVADFISTHLQAADDSITLEYDEETGVITVKANVTVEPIEDFKVAEPLVMVDGANYEKDMVIVGGEVIGDNLVFTGDWHPLFSYTNDPVRFNLNGDFTLNGNEFTPDNYLSIPYQLGDIIGFAGNTGADIAAGHIREEDGQFIFTHLLRVDGLTSSSIALAVKHVASKTPNSAGTTLDCVGSNPHSNHRISGKSFNDGACYFQINKNADGQMEAVFLRSTTNGFTAGVRTVCGTAQAISDTEKLNRVFFGGVGTELNPTSQFHIYRQPNINLADLTSQEDLKAFPDMANFAMPDETRTIHLNYDNTTITLDKNKRLCTSNLIAKKTDITDATTGIATEINSLNDRVTALEDKPDTPAYELPAASATALGGIKVGERLTVQEDGTLSADEPDLSTINTEIESLDARVTTLEDGSGSGTEYTLPIASSETLGGVKIGEGITIAEDGTISAQGGGEAGVTDYEELTNLPSINGVELKGDHSAAKLGLQDSFNTNTPLLFSQSTQSPSLGINLNTPNDGQMQARLGNRYVPWGSVNNDGSLNMLCYVEFPLSDSLAVTGNWSRAASSVQGTPASFPALIGTNINGKFHPVIYLSLTLLRKNLTAATLTDATYGDYISLSGDNINMTTGASSGLNKDMTSMFGYRVISETRIEVQAAALATSGDFYYRGATLVDLPSGITASQLNSIRLCCGYTSSFSKTYYSSLDAFKYKVFSDNFTQSNIPTYFNDAQVLVLSETQTQRYLNLSIDDETLKVNSDGKLYAVTQESTGGLPDGITVSETSNSIDFTTTKAINLDGSMVAMPENAVAKLSDGTEKLLLNQSSVEAGENITVEQTATGVKISSTASGGGEIDPEVLESKQDKLSDTDTVEIKDGSVTIPADTYTLHGGASVSADNKLTNTNGTKYLYIDKIFAPENKPWEIQCKFVPNSTALAVAGYVPLIAEYSTNKTVPQLYIAENGRIKCDVSINGSSWIIEEMEASATQTVIEGQVAYARLKYNGNGTYTVGLSLDGNTWYENSANVGGPIYQTSASKFIIGSDQREYGQAAYEYIDLNETYIKIDGEYFWHPFPIIENDGGPLGANVKVSEETGNTLEVKDDGLYVAASGASDKYGIQADYAVRHGILDCPNGLIDFSINNKQITVSAGIVLNCAGNGVAKTTIASPITHTITSPAGAITLFYAGGNILECGTVDYSTTQPEENGANNYQAWFNPDKTANPDQQWQFKSNDSGNVWRPVTSATPIADVVVGNTGITSVSYIGYRILNDDIIAQLSDIDNVQETVEALQTAVGSVQDDVSELTTTVSGHTEQLGGITIKEVTEAEYNALTTKAAHTLYVITDVADSN